MTTASEKWKGDLASWAIPQEILDQAIEKPWIHPPASHVIGVDEQEAMLEHYSKNALKFGVTSETVLGQWPEVADETPMADVVTVHHVVFNVGDIAPFLVALNSHARKRVVIEAPVVHPMSNMSDGWKHFWNVTQPTVPVAGDLIAILEELGITANIEYFEGEIWPSSGGISSSTASFCKILLNLT